MENNVAAIKTMNLRAPRLEINPFHNSLRLHKLNGTISEFYSVSIDMKYRIIIDFVIENNKIIPLNIGDHNLYK